MACCYPTIFVVTKQYIRKYKVPIITDILSHHMFDKEVTIQKQRKRRGKKIIEILFQEEEKDFI